MNKGMNEQEYECVEVLGCVSCSSSTSSLIKGGSVGLHGGTRADEVAVTIDVVNPPYGWPPLGLGADEGLEEGGRC